MADAELKGAAISIIFYSSPYYFNGSQSNLNNAGRLTNDIFITNQLDITETDKKMFLTSCGNDIIVMSVHVLLLQ